MRPFGIHLKIAEELVVVVAVLVVAVAITTTVVVVVVCLSAAVVGTPTPASVWPAFVQAGTSGYSMTQPGRLVAQSDTPGAGSCSVALPAAGQSAGAGLVVAQ